MSFDAQTLIAVLTVGLITGVITGLLTQNRGSDDAASIATETERRTQRRGFEFAADVATGIAGAFIGYTVLGLAGLSAGGLVASIINATFGSVIFLTLLTILQRIGGRIGSIVALDPNQEIRRLTVTPQPGALVVSFETVLPSRPNFEIFNYVLGDQNDLIPQNIVAVWGSEAPARRTHSRRIDGLPQGKLFWIRITADVEGVVSGSGLPLRSDTVVRKTGTLYRRCLLSIPQIHVGFTGDPEGDVTMDFVSQVYNGATGQNTQVGDVPHPGDPLIAGRNWQFKGVDNDRNVGPFNSPPACDKIPVEAAPDIIVPYISGLAELGFVLFGTATPPSLPDHLSHGSSDNAAWADSFAAFPPLLTTVGTTTSAPFFLATGLQEIEWTATLILETSVTDPRGALNL
jgi:uncharacterized membrane protein YeaQ/YmgE (transglycosylase-associated protein family)